MGSGTEWRKLIKFYLEILLFSKRIKKEKLFEIPLYDSIDILIGYCIHVWNCSPRPKTLSESNSYYSKILTSVQGQALL